MNALLAAVAVLFFLASTLPCVAQAPPSAALAGESFEGLLAKAQGAKNAGNFDAAAALVKLALGFAEAEKDAARIATANNSLAGIYRKQGKFDLAEETYNKVHALLVEHKQEKTEFMATLMDNQATLYDEMKNFERASQLRAESIKLYESLGGPKYDLAIVYANQAQNLIQLKNLTEAEVVAKKALALYKELDKATSAEAAMTIDALAVIYSRQNKYAEAEKMQKEALAIFEKTFGPESPDTAITLHNLATTEVYLGKFEEAKKLQERAVAITKKVYGPTSPETLHKMRQLARIMDMSMGANAQKSPSR
jgi:tetratricopeptide (TPR) repeat protein